MTDLWKETLVESSLDKVILDPTTRNVKTGREFTRYKYPYRKGQGVEDLGRKTYVWTLTYDLFAGISPKLYPGTYDELLAIIEDETKRGEVEYVDPELGAFDVKVADYDINTVGDRRNGASVTVVLEERAFDQSLLQNSAKLTARAAAAKASKDADYLFNQDPVPLEETDMVSTPTLTDAWRACQNALDTAALGADQVAAKIDEFVLVSEKFLSFSAEEEIARWSITCAVYDAIGAAYRVGDEQVKGEGSSGKVMRYTLPDEMSAMEVAQRYYGDAGMAELVMFNNPTTNPLIYPRGFEILVTP
jgi:prophage DNA circulation protein